MNKQNAEPSKNKGENEINLFKECKTFHTWELKPRKKDKNKKRISKMNIRKNITGASK